MRVNLNIGGCFLAVIGFLGFLLLCGLLGA